jgi:RecA/RadA recombinase
MLGVAHVHIIDSTKQAVSEEVLAASVRDWRPGIEARSWGKAFGFLNDRFDYEENVLILIDQVRVKNFQTGTLEPAGGKALDHASSMTALFRKSSWLFYDEHGNLSDKAKQQKSSENQAIPAGRVIQCRIEKSRVSRPLLPATMWLDLNTNNFDLLYELKKHGISLGIIEHKGSGNYRLPDEDGEVQAVRGDPALRQYLRDNEWLQDIIWDKSLEAANPISAKQ